MSHVLRLKKSFSLLSRFRRPMTVGKLQTCNTNGLRICPSCKISQSFSARSHVSARSYSNESAKLKEKLILSHKRKGRKKSLRSDEIKTNLIQVIDARAKQLACKIVKANSEDILLQLVRCNKNVSNNAFLVLPTSSKAILDLSSKNSIPAASSLEGETTHNVEKVKMDEIFPFGKDADVHVNWSQNVNAFKTQVKSLSQSYEGITDEGDGRFSAVEDLLSLKSFEKPADIVKTFSSSSVKNSLSSENNVFESVLDKDVNLSDMRTDLNVFSDSLSVEADEELKPDVLEDISRHKKETKEKSSVIDTCDTYTTIDSASLDIGVDTDWTLPLEDKDSETVSIPSTEKKQKKSKSQTNKKKTKTEDVSKTADEKQTGRGNSEKQNRLFNQDLLSFVETCCFGNKQAHAHSLLKFHHLNKSPTPENEIKDINIHNTLMHSWAKLGKLQQIKEVFLFIKRANLKPNLQSYAACFECLGRQKNFDAEMCQRILQDVKRDGFDIRDIFNACLFRRDERHFILKALKSVDPDFTPHPVPDPEPYQNVLLEDLNTKLPDDKIVDQNPYAGIMKTEDLQKRAEMQLQMELKGSVTVESIVKSSTQSPKTTEYKDKVEDVKEEWKSMLVKAYEKMLHGAVKKSKEPHTITLYPYLTLLPPLDMVECLMLEIEQIAFASDSFSICMDQLCRRAGMRVYNKYITQDKVRSKYAKKMTRLYEKYLSIYNDDNFPHQNHRVCWQHLMNSSPDGASLDVPERPWSAHIVKALGKKLYDLILNDVKIDSNILKKTEKRRMVPAFYTIYRNYGHRVFQEIKPHPAVVKLFHIADVAELTFDTSDMPMIVPPVPWVSKNHGGFLLGSALLIRLPPQAQNQTDQLEKIPPAQIYSVLDSLNTLGACPWVINKPMLDLIISIFNNKGMKDLDIPPPISECPPIPKISPTMSHQEKSKVFRDRLKLRQQKSEMYSLWCQELYRLSIANKFRDEIFWFPHNLDFRGRTYPYPPHFNHLGSDVARSILVFAKGKPLGEKGLDWLKTHLINLTGFKKRCSNAERLQYANEMMDEIMDSADNPLNGRKWWQSSDEPWQTLACCKEITNAVRSGDLHNFVSHFPVHQDGSCNGLQHYAALGRDQSGAESVNLHPFDKPQDVYSDIAELVEAARTKDEEDGVEIAAILKGFVRRKVIKQTVMTTVYGVTKYGAKLQILRQLKDIPDFPQKYAWAGSLYLTDKTFQCLMEMFSATKEIQDWLTTSAHLISTVCRKPVEWVTPLGLPVIQPYHRAVHFNKYGIQLYDAWSQFEKPNSVKQKNAFPPNFIHSLDSTHMMLTSLYCLQAGITFVSVHDCYWTHACDIAVMNKICRQQFVSLHSQPILENLSKHLVEKFAFDTSSKVNDEKQGNSQALLNSVLGKVPQKGNFNLENVLKSTYFFS